MVYALTHRTLIDQQNPVSALSSLLVTLEWDWSAVQGTAAKWTSNCACTNNESKRPLHSVDRWASRGVRPSMFMSWITPLITSSGWVWFLALNYSKKLSFIASSSGIKDLFSVLYPQGMQKNINQTSYFLLKILSILFTLMVFTFFITCLAIILIPVKNVE